NSLSKGRFSDMGSNFENLPSTDKGRGMSKAYKEAVAVFQTEIKTRKVVVDVTERGIIVSLSADAYFRPGSAELDIDQARSVLEKLAALSTKTDFKDKNVRIEGHTDSTGTDPNGPWPTNWKLSSARSLSVLDYLIDFGADPSHFSVVGYGEYQPIFPNDTEEHRSKNRRVDIVILRSK
ncbi:MAG TPA: OmpA family protein, partial [Spirochaetota bacterium]|nr:OmpA family protein [Spirochaetota bacterium]